MRRLSMLLTLALVACTVLAMIYSDTFPSLAVVYVGNKALTPFDLVFYLSLVLLAIGLLWHRTAPFSARTRLISYVVAAYCAFQLVVVVPVAVIAKGYSPLGALYAVSPRLGMLLVLFFALLVTRYWNGNLVSRILEWAALALFVVAIWRFVTGAHVALDVDTGRLRVLWGGGTLLFGWLLISRLLRERLRIRDLGMGIAGLAGVVLINHRAAYIALAVGLLAYLVARRRHVLRTIGVVVAIGGLAGLLIFAFFPALQASVRYSFATLWNPNADKTARDRVVRSELGLQTFAAYPLGDIIWRGGDSYYLVDLGALNFEPHNFVVQLLVKEGLVGFLGWSALLALALGVAFRNARRDHDSAVLGAYVVFYLVFCLLNTNFYASQNVVLLAAGVGLIMWRDRVVAVQENEHSKRAAVAPGTIMLPTQPHKAAAKTIDVDIRLERIDE